MYYREFWQLFVNGYGRLRMGVVICGLTVTISLLEGFNIGLLVPLLENLNSTDSDSSHWVSRAIDSLFDALGVPFELWSILVALSVLILGISVLKYVRLLLVAKLTIGFIVWMRATYMWNLLNADISFFHAQRTGVLADTLNKQIEQTSSSFQSFTELIANLGLVAAYLLAAFLISPSLSAVALGMLIVVTLTMQRFISKASSIGASLVLRHNEFQVASLENLNGVQVIKSFLLERLRLSAFNKKTTEVGETLYALMRNQARMSVLQEISMFGLIGVIVYVGVTAFGLGIAIVVALLFILYRLAPRISSVNMQRQGLAVSLAALHNVKNAMDLASEREITSGSTPFTGLKAGLELRNVSFSFNDSSQVLHDTAFVAETGKMTAIVGPSGAGKTTIMDLIMRFYDPSLGGVYADGVDLRELDLASWRKAIGVVSQDIFLFNDTVANNIGLWQPEITQQRIVDAAREAYADEFIQQLPDGYDTNIGDRGWNLSGGQRQRIALARAILRKPQILILDEATSSLDSESEELIQDYIRRIRGTCTMIVVAHRLSTIQDADKIVVLQDGRIADQGDWDSLLQGSEVFANYHRLQSGV